MLPLPGIRRKAEVFNLVAVTRRCPTSPGFCPTYARDSEITVDRMSDESHITQLRREQIAVFHESLHAWARTLDTTPERLLEILRNGGDGARYIRELLGLREV